MRNLLKQLKKGSREVRLTADEKSVMRQTLVRFAHENPIVHTSRSRAVVSPYSFMKRARGYRVLSATVIGGILIGGTVSFAAEGALPGNVLYPVKTELNERVRSVVAVTPEAKAEWDIKLVERRLSEVKEVSALDTVPLETKEVARENVRKYTDRVEKRIAEFDDNDDEENALMVAENLARVLRTHETMILEDIEGDDEEYETVDDTDDEKDVQKEITTKVKEPQTIQKKEVKQLRTTVASTTRSTKITATSTPSVKTIESSSTRKSEKRQDSGINSTRSEKKDTTSLEKTVDDIREMREELEKRNEEKKAEYERRKEVRKEEEKDNEKNEERKTYISAPSPEHER